MVTVQMTLDEELVKNVDRVAKQLHLNRSAFARRALREALEKFNLSILEHKHQAGYKLHPANVNEFNVWEKEQAWGDE